MRGRDEQSSMLGNVGKMREKRYASAGVRTCGGLFNCLQNCLCPQSFHFGEKE